MPSNWLRQYRWYEYYWAPWLVLLCLLALPITVAAQENGVIEPSGVVPTITAKAGCLNVVPINVGKGMEHSDLKLSLITELDFVMLIDNGNGIGTVQIVPPCVQRDGGLVTVVATDILGKTVQTSFRVAISFEPLGAISPISDLSVAVGQAINISLPICNSSSSGCIQPGDIVFSAPPFVTLLRSDNCILAIRIAPTANDVSGRITAQISNECASTTFSFNVTVERPRTVEVNSVMLIRPNLFISGIGFSKLGAIVTINGVNVSARIVGQSNTGITLQGSNKKLNLRKGENRLTVTVGGIVSNTFAFDL
ncbi:MAG: hypothetical protein AB1489_07950 [Acidobacteriota bacterium]